MAARFSEIAVYTEECRKERKEAMKMVRRIRSRSRTRRSKIQSET